MPIYKVLLAVADKLTNIPGLHSEHMPRDPADIMAVATFEYTVLAVVFAILALLATGLLGLGLWTYRRMNRDLSKMREYQTKLNNTLIVTSDLALNALPQVTFTQQIPGDIMDPIGIIDDIFEGEHGHSLWKSISTQPRVARLAYARAIYRFGLKPLAPGNLIGGRGGNESVLSLLNSALEGAEARSRDPVSLQRDILVRKCQTLRQAEQFDAALAVSKEIGRLGRQYEDSSAEYLEAWCRALTYMQRAMREDEIHRRHESFAYAKDIFVKRFIALFETSPLPPKSLRGLDVLEFYRQRWPRVELRSMAYYTAKSIWCHHFTDDATLDGFDAQRLRRAIDLSLLFYKEALMKTQLDPSVRCSYHMCVAFLIAVRREVLPEDARLEESSVAFPDLATEEGLLAHARKNIEDCRKQHNELHASQRLGGSQYIYVEHAERIDTLKSFERDIDLIESALSETRECNVLREFYRE